MPSLSGVEKSNYASAEEAKAMLEKAVSELRTNEREALSKFNSEHGEFRDRDLYVFCFNVVTGKMTATYNPSLSGMDIRTLKDANGEPIGLNIFNAAREGEPSAVEFMWPRPGSDVALPKEAYITRVADQGCGVGYYKYFSTVGAYLALRLWEMGVQHLFNVPGSYCGGFMRALNTFKRIQPVFTTYELEAVYAADAYSRLKGFGAFCGTYGVGGMSSINGVAGAFVERCPVIAINGGPSVHQLEEEIEQGILFLHSIGRLKTDQTLYRQVTVAAEVVRTAARAPEQIDAVLTACMTRRRPVYLEVSQDLWDQPCPPPFSLLAPEPQPTNEDALRECIDDVMSRVEGAKSCILWGGEEIDRWRLHEQFDRLVRRSGLRYVTTLPGKSILPETTPGFAGVYDGRFARAETQSIVSGADLVIALGTAITDFIGDIVSRDYHSMVLAAGGGVRVGFHTYTNISLGDFIGALTERLGKEANPAAAVQSKSQTTSTSDDQMSKSQIGHGRPEESPGALQNPLPITWDLFFNRMERFVEDKLTIADTSLALFASADLKTVHRSSFICQAIWMSIGYSLGASLGIACASDKRPVVFVGDAGFREGPQVLSTLAQYKLPAIVCVMSNAFLGIQQFLTGPSFYESNTPPDEFNIIPRWDYSALAKAFGPAFFRVTNVAELEEALSDAEHHASGPYLIEVVLDPKDLPKSVADALPRMVPSRVRADFEFPLISRRPPDDR